MKMTMANGYGEWLWRKPECIKTKIKKNKIKNINFLFLLNENKMRSNGVRIEYLQLKVATFLLHVFNALSRFA